MARHDNNYGAGGTNRDEFGPLPEKRIESMSGVESSAIKPNLPGNLSGMVFEFFGRTGKKPKWLIYPGPKVNTTVLGFTVPGLGYVGLNLHNVPNIEVARLE